MISWQIHRLKEEMLRRLENVWISEMPFILRRKRFNPLKFRIPYRELRCIYGIVLSHRVDVSGQLSEHLLVHSHMLGRIVEDDSQLPLDPFTDARLVAFAFIDRDLRSEWNLKIRNPSPWNSSFFKQLTRLWFISFCSRPTSLQRRFSS